MGRPARQDAGRRAVDRRRAESHHHLRDVTFHEDTATSRAGSAPANLATIRAAVIAASKTPVTCTSPKAGATIPPLPKPALAGPNDPRFSSFVGVIIIKGSLPIVVVVRDTAWHLGPGNEQPGEDRLGTAGRACPPAVTVTLRSRDSHGVSAAVDRLVDRRTRQSQCGQCHQCDYACHLCS
jgi:hypothetical protein